MSRYRYTLWLVDARIRTRQVAELGKKVRAKVLHSSLLEMMICGFGSITWKRCNRVELMVV